MTAAVTTGSVDAGGMTIAYLEAGEGPLVVLLHGFPDTADSWRPTLAALADAGFRAVAPYTRGIGPTTTPPGGDYAGISLAEDVVALIEGLGAESAAVVGQDWGALFAYLAAAAAPERVHKLVTMAIPHPRSVKPKLSMVRGLWHFAFFQLPWLPEWFMRRKNWRGIEFFFSFWSPSTDWTGRLDDIKRAYAEGGTLKAALGYYRAMRAAPWSARAKQQNRLIAAKTTVPTLTFAGLTDGALSPDGFAGSERSFTAGYELVEVPDAGHFLQIERPDFVLPKLIEFLKAP